MRERLLEVRTRTALQQVVEVDAKAFDSGLSCAGIASTAANVRLSPGKLEKAP